MSSYIKLPPTATAAPAAATPAAAAPAPQTQWERQTVGQTPNPWLEQQAQGIATNLTNNFNQSVMPQINAGAVMAGGYGGSRQGIAQGLAMQGLNRDIANAQANLYGQAYESDANRANQFNLGLMQNQLGWGNLSNQKDIANIGANASMYGANKSLAAAQAGAAAQTAAAQTAANASMNNANLNYQVGMANNATQNQLIANNYNLGLGQLGYNYAGLDANIANNNAQNQLAAGNFGLNVYNTLQGGNANAATTGTNIQNLPLNYYSTFANTANGIGNGFATTTNSMNAQSNPYLAALGGALTGANLYNAATATPKAGG